ncbi:YcgL domain-containing protein [Saccharophagus sp. K07]|jgi:uncharacterized protein YcgL (UPF0745 family)|uniref:YcgL domain-containing protein n=1 Tax=Saccharophagus sp. K07 TaxID=2283636 RepID=UPI001651E0CC|nr:YcgL domain-containing protein [Saccharophagus sp. K07]MBC6904486.1 YcgL domain-containing protein [Saccharophagus sp. K07]
MNGVLCNIYRSSKKDETYLYVEKSRGLACVPEALLELFGKPELVMTLLLNEQRRLARADIAKVLEALAGQGYYLQLPPPPETYMQEINKHNDKLI